MARKLWAISHILMTCDKCGDSQQDTQGEPHQIEWEKWRNLAITKLAQAAHPMSEQVYDLCPGCAGMLEHFLGLGVK